MLELDCGPMANRELSRMALMNRELKLDYANEWSYVLSLSEAYTY